MLKQRYRVRFDAPVGVVFAALVQVLSRSRWAGPAAWAPDEPPRPGLGYVRRRDSFTRRGRVVECLPPVALTLYESLVDPPCRVRLRLRWRLEPSESGCSLLLDAGYQLNGAAFLNRRHWRAQIGEHCGNLLRATAVRLMEAGAQGTVVSGQKTGSNSMTVTKTTIVNGNPSFK